MEKLLSGRRNLLGASLVSLLLIVSVVVTAVRTDGYRASHVDLNDASVWVSGENVTAGGGGPLIGRVNTTIGQINSQIPSGLSTNLVQDGYNVFYTTGAQLYSVDTSQEASSHTSLPSGASVGIGGGTAAILIATQIWVMPVSTVAKFQSKSTPPTALVDSGSLLVVGTDGVAYTYRPGATRGYAVSPSGMKHPWSLHKSVGSPSSVSGVDGATANGGIQLSVVGSTPVVLDVAKKTVETPGGSPTVLPARESVALQQPGPAASDVLVADGNGLATVPLHGGSVTRLRSSAKAVPPGMSGAIRPVIVQGCAYGAWPANNWEQRICPAQPQFAFSAPYAQGSASSGDASSAVFRVNHDRVVLNNTATGDSWVLNSKNQSKLVTHWQLPPTKKDMTAPDPHSIDLPSPKRDCTKDSNNPAIAAQQWHLGARVGIPVILSLAQIPQLQAPQCSVLNIATVTMSDPSAGSVVKTGDGSAMQITMQRAGPATIKYSIDDGAGRVTSSTVAVAALPDTKTGDLPPTVKNANAVDNTPTLAVGGVTMSYNALAAASDPDGDPLSLVDACVGDVSCLDSPAAQRSTAPGTVQYQPNGWIRFTPPPSQNAGLVTLSFTVADQWGLPSRGSVAVDIENSKSAAPITHDDRATIMQGQTADVPVLANDVSPAGRHLSLQSFQVKSSPSSMALAQAAITRSSDDGLEVSASAPPGTTLVSYVTTDGVSSAEGYARIDVVAPKRNPPVTAVLDTAVTRGKQQILVDVTANDFDAAGDVLVVQSVKTNLGSAQLLPDGHTIRVTPPDGFIAGSTPMNVAYTVSNGTNSTVGTLLVSPYPGSATQPPYTEPDGPVTVKAGGVISIPVLANDTDPQGAPLTLVSVQQPSIGRGTAFVEGNEVRFVAPTGVNAAGPAQFSYTVSDAPLGQVGQQSSGQVMVQVLPATASDPAPNVLSLTATAIQGRMTHVPVPLLSADPNGGILGIAGVVTSPMKGTIAETGDGFDYTPGTASSDVGTDTVTFQLTNGTKYSTSTLRIGVVPPTKSTGPVATPITAVVKPGRTRSINLLDSGFVTSTAGGLWVQVKKPGEPQLTPATGRGSISTVSANGIVSYTAPTTIGGARTLSASIHYIVQDASGQSTMNVVEITIDPSVKALAPQPQDDFAMPARAHKRVSVNIVANDQDPSSGSTSHWKVALVGAPAGAALSKGVVSFNMPGQSVRFRYRVTNPDDGLSAQAVVSIPLNGGVICTPTSIAAKAKAAIDVDVIARCSGPPGTKVHLVGTRLDPTAGSATVQSQKVHVTVNDLAASGAFGLATQVCIDGPPCNNTTTTVTDTVNIEGINTPPSLDYSINVPADGEQIVDLSQQVVDPNPGDAAKVQFSNISGASGDVTATLTGTILTVDAGPDAYANGNANVTLRVKMNDTQPNGIATGTIKVHVTPTIDQIVAVDDQETVVQGIGGPTYSFPVLANDLVTSKHGGSTPLEIASISSLPVLTGSVRTDGTSVLFKPAATFGGDTSFTYNAALKSDSAGKTGTATVTVHVVGYPGQPGTPQGVDKENKQATLQWVAADGNGGPIDRYTVKCQQADGGACPTSQMQATGTSLVYTGLHNNVAYTFQVRAHNEAGDGKNPNGGWSQPSPPITPDQLPAVPTVQSVGSFGPLGTDNGGSQLTIKWSEPPFEGSPVTQYTVHVVGSGDFPVGLATTYTAKNLVNGTSYPVWVSATNHDGENPSVDTGSAYAVSGVPAAPPGSPVITGVDPSDSQLTAHWNTPTSNNGDAVSSYEIQATSPGQPTITTTSSTVSAVISGTKNGAVYGIQVRALNKAGAGAWSAPFTQHSSGAPLPIASASSQPGDGVAILNFTQKDTQGSDVNLYNVQSNGVTIPASQITFSPNPAPAGAVTLLISGLTNGISYGPFSVQACNQSYAPGGTSLSQQCAAYAPAGVAVTPFGAPTATITNVAGSGTSTITWTWSGTPNGEPVDHYVLSNAATSGNYKGNSWTGNFSTCGQTVTLSVQAVSTSQNVTQTQSSASSASASSAPCPPPPSLTITEGASAPLGTCYIGNANPCFWVDLSASHIPPGAYTAVCHEVSPASQAGDFPAAANTPITIGPGGTYSGQLNCAVGHGIVINVRLDPSTPPYTSNNLAT